MRNICNNNKTITVIIKVKYVNAVEKEFDALAPEYEENRLADWYQAHAEEILKH